MPNGIPNHDTFIDVMKRLVPRAFASCSTQWCHKELNGLLILLILLNMRDDIYKISVANIIRTSSPQRLEAYEYYSNSMILECISKNLSLYIVRIYDELESSDIDILKNIQSIEWFDLQNHTELSEITFNAINAAIQMNPNARIWLMLNGNGPQDISFLKYLPNLKNLKLDSVKRNEISTINKHLELEKLFISGYGISLKGIERQSKLKEITISEKLKDIDFIGKLKNLEVLRIDRMTLKTFDFFKKLVNLKELHFTLGSAIELDFLEQIPTLEKISFTYVRNLDENYLLVLNKLKSVKSLKLDYQPRIYSLDWLKNKNIKVDIGYCKNFGKSQNQKRG